MLAQIFDADTDATDDTTADAVPGDATPTAETVPDLSLDAIFDVLRNERRRLALRHIADSEDDEITFGDLVDHVAARENDAEIGAVDSGTRKAVYTSLYQSHLPKLDDMGVLTYDRQSGPVRAGPHLDEVLACLDAVLSVRDAEEDAETDGRTGLGSLRAAIKA